MSIPGAAINKINILIIEDDEEDFLIIRQYISKIQGNNVFSVNWSGSYQDGMDAIRRGEYQIYFVDYRLGAHSGLDLIKEAIALRCEQPIILLTGASNQDIDLHAMQAGAADYLVKSELNTEKLERCIRYAVARHEFLNALKDNEQKYRSIFEKTKDFIFIADEHMAFKEVNPVGESLFGYTADAFQHMRLTDLLVYPEDAQLIENLLQSKGEINDRELDLRAKNQQTINCVLSLSREKDAGGENYIQGIVHDISAIKNAEKAALQTTRLNATERLVRTLAHEVRNPLNNIILAVEQLDTPKLENEKIYLDIVIRNSNRINKLITELLYTSKPALIKLEQTSLQSILEKSIGAARDRLTLKKVALEEDYFSGSAMVMADPDKLSMAFLNIIINAIEASPAEGALIKIKLAEERDNYVASVTDNGHGISQENLGQLFEPYFTSKAAGMGLGLAAALSIFESHRALVQVKSALNVGTTFHLIFKK